MLELEDIKKLHDKAFTYSQVTRERASDDLVFYWITQWDDNILQESQLAYRGEFNIIRKAGRQIMSDLAANPVQVDFTPVDENRDDSSDLADGLYRSDDNNNTSLEAYSNAKQESVVCGVAAWEIFTKYESYRDDENRNQVIRRRPIYEANNTVFWDPNAKLLDKGDSSYVSLITPYSEDGYLKLVEELTGEELDSVDAESFKQPEHSYTFPWIGGESKKIYVATFYHRELVKEKIVVFTDPLGQERLLREEDIKNVMDEMIDAGYEITGEKQVNRYKVTKYIASGSEILASVVIPGEHIPIIPAYGERAIVEGEEHYEGITRLAKDPQRLRNFQMSYLADIVSQSPREKPIFLPAQVAGFEDMYSLSGADSNYPYLLQNEKSEAAENLPYGPVGLLPAPQIPQALAASIPLAREAVEDVANPGLPQDVADPDMSGKAILAVQNRIDMQSMVYQEHFKHAKRRDGEVWASMAAELYDVPRRVTITKPDGTRQQVQMMETVVDSESGELVTLNDISNVEFEVFSEIGPAYTSKKEQTVERLGQMTQGLDPNDPLRNILIMKTIQLMDGVNFDDIRDYAKKQLMLQGIIEPETPEDEQVLAQAAQKQSQPSAEMLLAMAEMKKAEADHLKEQREMLQLQIDSGIDKGKLQIDGFKAQTDRAKVEIDAKEAGVNINMKGVETLGKRLDNMAKLKELRKPEQISRM